MSNVDERYFMMLKKERRENKIIASVMQFGIIIASRNYQYGTQAESD